MSATKELNKVRLEPRHDQDDDESDMASIAGSEVESAPTDDGYADEDFRVDAIKWAKFRNSVRDRSDGWKGWHYGVMWNGYLKTSTETEEPVGSFNFERGKKSLITQFWEALDMKPRPGRKEPTGSIGMELECPPQLLREWFKENPTKKSGLKYRRDYPTYKRRRAKEIAREKLEKDFREVPEDLFTKKADSDYYLFKKQLRERRRRLRQQRESSTEARFKSHARVKSTHSPTPQASRASSSKPQPAALTVSEQTAAPAVTATLGSPASTLGSLFDSDREDVEQELRAASSEEEQEEVEVPTKPPKSVKRKAPSESPVASTSTSAKTAEQNKRAKKEERAARLANAGKIAKRAATPPSASSVTFGELQDGIFDLAPTNVSIPKSSAVPSVPKASDTTAPTIKATSSLNSVSTVAPAPPTPAAPTASTAAALSIPVPPPAVAAPKPALSAVQVALATLKAQQAAPVKPSLHDIARKGSASKSPPNIQDTLPTSTDRPQTANRIPSPPLSALPSIPTPTTSVATPPVQPARPAPQNTISSVGDANSGPVPHFNPAPVIPKGPRNAPANINKPKYVQPVKVKMLDDSVDPRQARKMANAGRPQTQATSASSTLPARPATTAFAPRQTYPPEPYGQVNARPHADDSSRNLRGSSPRIDVHSPKIPTGPALSVALPADPRRKAQTSNTSMQHSLPTPVSTPTQVTKEAIPVDFPLEPVDITGGLVTFSPLLILRHPGKFINMMKMCMTNDEWGAYLTPAALEFINSAWLNRQICPDATTAYSVLIQFLPLDDQLRELAGAGISSGGGMSISCCAPSPYQADACVKWKTWLYDVQKTTEYEELVGLCEQINKQRSGPAFASIIKNFNVDKIEEMQVEDLKNMRSRKDTINYTRFVYVSDVKRAATTEGVECISADEFIDILQRSNEN